MKGVSTYSLPRFYHQHAGILTVILIPLKSNTDLESLDIIIVLSLYFQECILALTRFSFLFISFCLFLLKLCSYC